jgi:hypothetical protein
MTGMKPIYSDWRVSTQVRQKLYTRVLDQVSGQVSEQLHGQVYGQIHDLARRLAHTPIVINLPTT